MEKRIASLIKILEEDVIDTEQNGVETVPLEYIERLNKIINLNKPTKHAELSAIPNFEIFQIFFIALNASDKSYEELIKISEPLKDTINNWTFENSFQDLRDLVNLYPEHEEKLPNENAKQLEKLGLKSIKESHLKHTLVAMVHFLNFKSKFKSPAISHIKVPYIKNTQFTIISNISDTLDNLKIFKDCFAKTYRLSVNFNKNNIKYSNELIAHLREKGLDGIGKIKPEWYEYILPDAIYELLLLLMEKGTEEYFNIMLEKESLSAIINKTPLTKVLFELGININSLSENDIKVLEQENIELLKQRFNLLIKIGFAAPVIVKKYLNLLTEISEENIKIINALLDNGALKAETLLANPQLMNQSFKIILTNYEILKPFTDFNNIHYEDNILTINPTSLKNILSVLAEYNLTRNNYIFLLCHYCYLNIYDLMLENEIPLYLFISICHTKNPIQTLRRIIYCKEVGSEFETQTHTLRRFVTDETKFVCDDETLCKYYPDFSALRLPKIDGEKISSIKEDQFVKMLEQKYRIEDCYFIGDAIVSRPKFLKKYQAIKDNNNLNNQTLISSFLDDSIASEANYFSIISELDIEKSYLL